MENSDSQKKIVSELFALYEIIREMSDVQSLGEYFIVKYRECLNELKNFFKFNIEDFTIKQEEIELRYPMGFRKETTTIAITPEMKQIYSPQKFVDRTALLFKMKTLIIFLKLKVEK